MKNLKRFNFGVVLIYVFLISTVALIAILVFNLMPERSNTVIKIWLVELFLVMGYCLFFYDAGQARKGVKRRTL
ncbi:MAG: hypothetical protein NTY95_05725 [Bacteroidia bacterium]|jgi:hypothetical protein|nr:hypothetical protein [Bacteroidia bacterium]